MLAIATREQHVGSDRQSMTRELTWTLLSVSDSVVQSNVPAAAHCGPGLQGQRESDSPLVSCEHILAKSDDHHMFTFLLLCRPCYLNLDRGCKRRRPSFLFSESDAPLSQSIESAPVEAFDVHNERVPELSPAALRCVFL